MGAAAGNKNALGNDGGRPAMYETAEDLQAKIDEYFGGGANKRTYATLAGPISTSVYTVSGLAYFLGFSSRQSFYDYENRIEFSDNIKRARLRIEISYEENLLDKACTGSIFALKNMGWSDKSEIDHNVNVSQLPPITIRTK